MFNVVKTCSVKKTVVYMLYTVIHKVADLVPGISLLPAKYRP